MTPLTSPAAAEDPRQETIAPQMPIDIRSAALRVLATLSVVLVLQIAQPVLIPVILSLLISYALDPMVVGLSRLRIPRPLGAALLLVLLVGALGILLYGLRTEASDIVEQMPAQARHLRELFDSGQPKGAGALHQVQKAASEIEKAATSAASPPPTPKGVTPVQVEAPPLNISDYLVWGSVGLLTMAGQIVLILFLVYFLLASGNLYRRKFVKLAGPTLAQKKITVQILEEIDRQIEIFLGMQLVTTVLVSVALWLAFRWAGVQQPAVWGILGGIFNSIPYFGPVLVTAGAAGIALLQFGAFHHMLVVGGLALLITSLEGFVLTPWVTSRAAGMNVVAVFVGLLFWGWIWGVWGLLLAVPMLVAIKSICDRLDELKPFGELLGR